MGLGAVHEEEDALRAAEFDEPVALGDGHPGLARAGGHLDEGARMLAGEGLFEAVNGFNLAVAQAAGVEGRECLEAGAQGFWFFDKGAQSFRAVDAENETGAGPRIEHVSEPGVVAIGFVSEREGIGPTLEVGEGCTGVDFRLVGHAPKAVGSVFGLKNPNGFTIYK